MAKNNKRKLSDANLEIMKVVWRKGSEVTINEVLEAVNAGRRKKLKRATIQVQMKRLEKYGWLKHRVINREFLYAPLRKEEEVKHRILNNIRHRVFGGSHVDLVRCLFENGSASDEELRLVREILSRREKE